MQEDFPKQFIKGKITELIFEQMFREAKKYTVIPFGYESVMPELVQYAQKAKTRGLFETIKNAPDFAVVSQEPTSVMLVEVKYRSNITEDEVKKTTAVTIERWKLAHVFYATPEGFYFDKCSDLMKDGAKLTPLSEDMISSDLQKKYLTLLTEFIKK